MKKIIFISLLFSCYFVNEGHIIEKNFETECIYYSKEEIVREEPYLTNETYLDADNELQIRLVTKYRHVHTGLYEYYKHIDDIDYYFIIKKVFETKKAPVTKTRKIYINKKLYNSYGKGNFIVLKNIKYNLFANMNKKIEISKEEYLNNKGDINE